MDLRTELQELRNQKRVSFHELDRLIRRIVSAHSRLFPKFGTKEKGSRVVYHFHAPGIYPISLEREHKGRDCVLPRYAKIVMNMIDEVITFVENQP